MTTPVVPNQPAANSPAAQPKPVAPAPVAAPVPVKSAEAIELENTRRALEQTKAQLDKKTKENITTRRAAEDKVKSFGEKLKDADWAARIRKLAPIDRVAVAKELWGDKWYESLTEAQMSGGAPSAAAIQAEFEKRDNEWEQKLKARDEEAAKKAEAAKEEASKAAVAETRRRVVNEAAAFVKASGADYPIAFSRLGDRLPQVLAQRIEAHFNATHKEDAEGNVTQQGVIQTPQQALESLENDLYAFAEAATAAPKYADKLRSKLTPAATSGGNAHVAKPSVSAVTQQQPQRSVNNGLTASTNSRPERRTEAQRRADAEAAFERARANRAQ